MRRPGRLARAVLRAPGRLYDWHLGWLLGSRFLRLTHVGRRSGRTYRTVLEVVGRNPDTHELIVVCGRGRAADWYQNLQAAPGVEIAVGRSRFRPGHRLVATDEAERVLARYERRNRLVAPLLRWTLSRLVGWPYDGSAAARRRLVESLPMVAFHPAARLRKDAP